jgi:hypothetical protein
MSNAEKIRIELTAEQTKQIRETCGHEIKVLEFEPKDLEQRIAPACASGTHIPVGL